MHSTLNSQRWDVTEFSVINRPHQNVWSLRTCHWLAGPWRTPRQDFPWVPIWSLPWKKGAEVPQIPPCRENHWASSTVPEETAIHPPNSNQWNFNWNQWITLNQFILTKINGNSCLKSLDFQVCEFGFKVTSILKTLAYFYLQRSRLVVSILIQKKIWPLRQSVKTW